MLVIANGMNRSGSTLQYNLVRGLLEKLGLGHGAGYIDLATQPTQFDQLEGWRRAASITVIKSHSLPPDVDARCRDGTVRVCYVYRDIRDVAASFKRRFDQPHHERLAQLDRAIVHFTRLKTVPDVLWQKYEDVVQDVPRATKEIADHLGLPAPREVVDAVAAEWAVDGAGTRTSQQRLRLRVMMRVLDALDSMGAKDAVRRHLLWAGVNRRLSLFDRRTLLHPRHISATKGRPGAWRTVLDHDEQRVLNTRFRGWLLETGYTEFHGPTDGAGACAPRLAPIRA